MIWENLSITPCVPKSGEQEDHIAPIVLVAIKHSTVSIWFAVYAAILSFSLILLSLKNLTNLKVLLFNLNVYWVNVLSFCIDLFILEGINLLSMFIFFIIFVVII